MSSMLYMSSPINALLEGFYRDDITIDTLKTTPAQLRHPEKQNRPESPVLRKPDWLRVKAPGSGQYNATRAIVKEKGLHTVCEEAACPNIGECWSQKHATLMIMGCVGRTGLSAALLGNTAEHVVDRLNCDILILKPDDYSCPVDDRRHPA